MKRFILLFFFLSVWAVVLSLSAQEVDVFLIGGQSNATGQGYVRNIPATFKVDTTVRFLLFPFSQSGGRRWTVDGFVLRHLKQKDKFGVELSLGTKLQSLYPERRIALIKHALSGSNLYKQWNPGNRPGNVRGEEYVKFVETVKNALVDLKKQGYRPIIRAMVWQQGEADARDIAGMDQSRRYGPESEEFYRTSAERVWL